MSLFYKRAVLLTRKTHFCNFGRMFVIFITPLCKFTTPFLSAVFGMILAMGEGFADIFRKKHSTHKIKEGLA